MPEGEGTAILIGEVTIQAPPKVLRILLVRGHMGLNPATDEAAGYALLALEVLRRGGKGGGLEERELPPPKGG